MQNQEGRQSKVGENGLVVPSKMSSEVWIGIQHHVLRQGMRYRLPYELYVQQCKAIEQDRTNVCDCQSFPAKIKKRHFLIPPLSQE